MFDVMIFPQFCRASNIISSSVDTFIVVSFKSDQKLISVVHESKTSIAASHNTVLGA